MLELCEKCGSMMVPVKKGESTYLKCTECDFVKKKEIKCAKLTEQGKKKEKVATTESSVELPITNKMCPKCEHTKAYYFLRQTRSADEPPTQFFKCAKCGHNWREY